MRTRHAVCLSLAGVYVWATAKVALAQAPAPPPARPAAAYDTAYLGAPLADPVMQHAKETFVLFGCAYCHGLALVPRGEAADLMHSARVGADVDGSILGPLLRVGIPQTAKLSPMPRFSDLSDRQIADLVRYIHYARQQGRLRELTAGPVGDGSAPAGRELFSTYCATCHQAGRSLTKGRPATELRKAVLAPPTLQESLSFAVDRLQDSRRTEARHQHQRLLENLSFDQIADLLTFLRQN